MFFELLAQPLFIEKAKEIEQLSMAAIQADHENHQTNCGCCNCLVKQAHDRLPDVTQP
jgi:hypothetical protein